MNDYVIGHSMGTSIQEMRVSARNVVDAVKQANIPVETIEYVSGGSKQEELEDMDRTIGDLSESLNDAEDKIGDLEDQIGDLEDQIISLKKQIQ